MKRKQKPETEPRNLLRRDKAFKLMLEAMQKDSPVYMGRILEKAGYSPSICRVPKAVTGKTGWQMLKQKYADDEKALQVLNEQMDRSNTDKDNRQRAAVWTLKLNDRFPASKSKSLVLFDKVSNLFDD